MIGQIGQTFILDTHHTTYCFCVTETGHLEHLHYGRKITILEESDAAALTEKQEFAAGNLNVYSQTSSALSLEDIRLEMSSYGKGDVREPLIEVIRADGSYTSDFLFEKAEIRMEKHELKALPSSYDEGGQVQELVITLKDIQYDLVLELYYAVFEKCDVITRSARLINEGEKDVRLTRLMSMQLCEQYRKQLHGVDLCVTGQEKGCRAPASEAGDTEHTLSFSWKMDSLRMQDTASIIKKRGMTSDPMEKQRITLYMAIHLCIPV